MLSREQQRAEAAADGAQAGTPEPGEPAAALALQARADGRLWLLQGGKATPVQPVRCFPWSEPDQHISLRDAEGEEHGYVQELRALDADSRAALEHALRRAGLVLEVLAIDDIDEDQEMRCYAVQTRQGPRRFQTRLETWPRPVPGGGLLIEDVAGDLFLIAQPNALDAASRRRLWPYVD